MTTTMQESAARPIRVTFFGDSICVGQGVSIYRGWVTRIARYLDEYSSEIGREVLVANSSINGRTTRQALEDMPYSVQSSGVDILIIQFGLNDCNHWVTDQGLPRVSRTAFIENLREIVTRGLKFGAFRVLLNNNHPTDRNRELMAHTNMTYEMSNRAYNQAVRDLAAELGPQIVFQDIEMHFNEHIAAGYPVERFLLSDGLHLSEDGHNVYEELMRPVIRTVVDDFVTQSK